MKKSIQPEKIEGYITIADKKIKISSAEGVEERSSTELKKIIKKLSKGKIFPLPEHMLNG